MSTNTMNLEDFITTLDEQYRLSPYLMLRGSVSYKAAKLAGMYAAKKAKPLCTECTDCAKCRNDPSFGCVETYKTAVRQGFGGASPHFA